MTTRMVHPVHGATHAYDTGEVERLKGFGWSVEGESPAIPEWPEKADMVIAAHFGVPVNPERKKPGPKPKAK